MIKRGRRFSVTIQLLNFGKGTPLPLLRKQSTDLFHVDSMIQEKISGVLDTGKFFRMGAYVLQTPPLQDRGAEIVIAPVCNKAGRVNLAVITLLESTTLQESQAREHEDQ